MSTAFFGWPGLGPTNSASDHISLSRSRIENGGAGSSILSRSSSSAPPAFETPAVSKRARARVMGASGDRVLSERARPEQTPGSAAPLAAAEDDHGAHAARLQLRARGAEELHLVERGVVVPRHVALETRART